ncbi:hypothetical protein GCM10023215_22970 [Pseudonocardia yuanmonensis]|uniref:DUF5313 domain-containing protein n=1 Tax=Pseudonocardia yuanmonensis TaxID=1095914 RepID=A0ABP8WCJ4_9PSEU
MTGIVRPGPLRWLAYAFGAGLPARHREWVLHDVTVPTWVLRHLVRAVVQIAPVGVALYLLVPGSPGIRVTAVVMGAAIGLVYSLAFVEPAAEHRAIKAGYPEGTAAATRRERRRRGRPGPGPGTVHGSDPRIDHRADHHADHRSDHRTGHGGPAGPSRIPTTTNGGTR